MEDKKNIGHVFDGIAGTYDLLNHLLSLNIDRSWRRKTIATLTPCQRLLDVAIGTADLSLEVMNQNKAEFVQGLDVSQEMMKIGEEKVRKAGLEGKIAFQLGSALEMPYDNASYDAVTCAYGVRNFPDADKGLQEFYRVMKPGGQLAILEFSYPENPIIRWGYDLFFSHILPFVGRIISHDKGAYTYLDESVKNFMWGEEMCEHIRKAGFKDVKFRPVTFGITTIYTARK